MLFRSHPEMKASAIRAAAANFENCLEHLWPLAAKRNISRASFDRHVKGLTPDLRIMDLMDAQPEFTKAFWDYLDILVNDKRIATGQEMLAKHKAAFDKVEKEYGVDRYIITAIWGVESNYGTLGGDRPVIRSTATLACVGRRQAYFRDEFLSALEILHRGDVTPDHLKGSWAGAFGPTQFMPTSFKRFAVDFDGDGRDDDGDDDRQGTDEWMAGRRAGADGDGGRGGPVDDRARHGGAGGQGARGSGRGGRPRQARREARVVCGDRRDQVDARRQGCGLGRGALEDGRNGDRCGARG